MKKTAIIVSAGRGTRMNSNVPKQYLEINGKPLLYFTLSAFEKSTVDEIIIVTGQGDTEYVRKEIVEKYGIKKVSAVVAGGKERCDSVHNGLLAAAGADIVLIHDGARPCVSGEMIEESIRAAKEYGAALAAVPVKDTIKVVNPSGIVEQTPDRNMLYAAQTPQSFRYQLIREAFDKMYAMPEKERRGMTDDVMVVQNYGGVCAKIVEGSYRNLKVTTPEDMKYVEEYLKNEF